MTDPEPSTASEEEAGLFTATTVAKIKNTTLTGSPVANVTGTQAKTFWKTAKSWVDGLAGDAITPLSAGAIVGLHTMTHTGTPPTGFAGSAEVVDYPSTKAVWTGKGWA